MPHVTMLLALVLLLPIVTAMTAEEVETESQGENTCSIFALLPFSNPYVNGCYKSKTSLFCSVLLHI